MIKKIEFQTANYANAKIPERNKRYFLNIYGQQEDASGQVKPGPAQILDRLGKVC